MKKSRKSFVLILLLTLGNLTFISAIDRTVDIDASYRNILLNIHGTVVNVDQENEPFIHNGRTYVPLRIVSEALGYEVAWDSNQNMVQIGNKNTTSPNPALGNSNNAHGQRRIRATYRNIVISVNGKVINISSENEPFIYNARTYVPLRVVSEALGYGVRWNGSTNTITIGDPATLPPEINPNEALFNEERIIADYIAITKLDEQIAQIRGAGDEWNKIYNIFREGYSDEITKRLADYSIIYFDYANFVPDSKVNILKLDKDKNEAVLWHNVTESEQFIWGTTEKYKVVWLRVENGKWKIYQVKDLNTLPQIK